MGIRGVVRWLWAGLLAVTGCTWWAKRRLCREGGAVVLAFHRVLAEADYARTRSPRGMVARQRSFAALAAYAAREYEIVEAGSLEPGKPGRKLRVAFTFDDGWSDTGSVAMPIAQAHGIPLTVFVCPGLVGRETPFWPERAAALLGAARPWMQEKDVEGTIERLKWVPREERDRFLAELEIAAEAGRRAAERCQADSTLSWDQIRAMAREGVRFGAHTQTHEILTVVSEETARGEIRRSKEELERALGAACEMLAYPNGRWSGETRRMVAEAGFGRAFTVERRAWTAGCDSLAIPRVNVAEDDLVGPGGAFSPAIFEYAVIWKSWRAAGAGASMEARGRRRPASVPV